MSHYKQYRGYKDSGVEWLGAMPDHWVTSKLGYECWVRARLGWKGLKAEEYVDEGYALLATPNIKGKEIDFVDVNFISKERYDESPEIKLNIGDVLLAKDGSTLGTVNIIRELPCAATVNSSIAVITPGSNLSGFFLHYFFQSTFVEHTIQSIKGGMGVPHLFQEDLNRFNLPLPPKFEQELICAHLDGETTRIDALVEKKTRFIALLREKREALVTYAVTKGLDPSVNMKDSGVEWLGQVPMHWTVKQLGYFADVLRGKFSHRPRNDPDFYDGEFPFIQTGDITGTARYITSYKQTLNERGIAVSKEFPRGTLVMAIAANIGDVAILDFPAYFPDSIVGLVPTRDSQLMFLFYLMQAMKPVMLTTATISTQMNLNIEKIVALVAAQPPLSEQVKIVEHIDRESARLDALIRKTERSVTLLKERRAALISAAVTGQIDFREAA